VRGRSKSSKEIKLRRSNAKVCKSQTCSKSKAQRRDNATRVKRDQELGSQEEVQRPRSLDVD
jgi:hypothetical protein